VEVALDRAKCRDDQRLKQRERRACEREQGEGDVVVLALRRDSRLL
jgi:hypothetical protein